MTFLRFVLALATASLAATACYPALKLERWKRFAVFFALAVPIMLSPLLIPPAARLLRTLAAINGITTCLKLYDLCRAADREPRPSFVDFQLFLANWSSLVLRKLSAEPDPSRSDNLRRLTRGLVELACGVVLVVVLFWVGWDGPPFFLQHLAKAIAVQIVAFALAVVVVALWRLAGRKARDFMEMPFLAPTPTDFWRRYNRGVTQFCYENIFKPAGGRRAPIRAALLVFAVSAIGHEYIFGIAIGRVQGYQTAFFMLQGVVVAATARANPQGWARLPWTVGTLAFNLASAVFFFASVNSVMPFYSGALPSWLAD